MVIGSIEAEHSSSRDHKTITMEVEVNSSLQQHSDPGAGSSTATFMGRMDQKAANHSNGSTPSKSTVTPHDSPFKKDEATPSPSSKDKFGTMLQLLLEKDKEALKHSPPVQTHRKTTSLEENKKDNSPGLRHSMNYTATLASYPSAGYAKRNSLDGTLRTTPVSPRYDRPPMYPSLNKSQSELIPKQQDIPTPQNNNADDSDLLMKEFNEIQQLFDRVEKSSRRLAEDYGKISEGSSSKEKLMEDYQLLRSENTRLVHQVTQLNQQNQKSQQTIETLTKSKTQENNAKTEQLLSILSNMKDLINSQNIQLPDNIKQQLENLDLHTPANHKKPTAFAPLILSGPVAPAPSNNTPRNSSSSSNKVRICKTTGKPMNQLIYGPLNFSDSQPSSLTRYKWTCCGITTKEHP